MRSPLRALRMLPMQFSEAVDRGRELGLGRMFALLFVPVVIGLLIGLPDSLLIVYAIAWAVGVTQWNFLRISRQIAQVNDQIAGRRPEFRELLEEVSYEEPAEEAREPIPEPVPEPTPEPTPEPALDDFMVIRGIGAVSEKRLNAAGIKTYAELAQATPEDLEKIVGKAPRGTSFEALIDQARELSAGV